MLSHFLEVLKKNGHVGDLSHILSSLFIFHSIAHSLAHSLGHFTDIGGGFSMYQTLGRGLEKRGITPDLFEALWASQAATQLVIAQDERL